MITRELIERINYYAQKQRKEGLTEEEKAEQKKLRENYIAAIRERVKHSLDSVRWFNPGDLDSDPKSCGLGPPDERPNHTH
ncbi:MAG: DUF896 domain-containing protein [Syntrophomonadaceae bacterium]|nr:DUF896 domain-containing protein [Syntrophomonadaceae bacterium]